MPPKTLYQKIWDNHVVWEEPGQPALIYIERHLIHEGTSPQAFAGLYCYGSNDDLEIVPRTAKSRYDILIPD